jgi:hypothetical protein
MSSVALDTLDAAADERERSLLWVAISDDLDSAEQGAERRVPVRIAAVE